MSSDNSSTHVIVGMSGGVDSSVAALCLLEQGYRVSGIFMQNWEDDDEHCTIREDYRDASAVATKLGIPLSTVNFADEYWEMVFAHFLEEYGAGRTPNPDILCNKEIKFRAFLDYAQEQGADAIATGHYVRTGKNNDEISLLRGLDANKDQSYFLHSLSQSQIAASLFPVGEMEKSEVRDKAKDAGFHLHKKKDSTGICFIGERKFSEFLAQYLPAKPGEIVDEDGKTRGSHNGLMFYTLGQRQGLGIGGVREHDDSPWYVLDKDLANNVLLVGQGHDNPRLHRNHLHAHNMHWVSDKTPKDDFVCTAKVRYRQQDQAVRISLIDEQHIRADFTHSVRAATPGQSLVLYDGERCLGGGVISDF
jgi:tRNA-specific 2-thiouridylase